MRRTICLFMSLSFLAVAFPIAENAYAAVDGYLVKDSSGNIFSYDKNNLEESFINEQYGGDNKLFQDFKPKFKANGFYAFHDDAGKYINYSAIENAFIDNPNNFNVDSFTEQSNDLVIGLPSTIKKVSVKNGGIAYDDLQVSQPTDDNSDNDNIDYKLFVLNNVGIQEYQGWEYFGNKNGLFKMNLNEAGTTVQVLSIPIWTSTVIDGVVFYEDYDDFNLYRINLDGTGKKRLTTFATDTVYIENNKIYVSGENVVSGGQTGKAIVVMDLNGENAQVKFIPGLRGFTVNKGWIYYSKDTDVPQGWHVYLYKTRVGEEDQLVVPFKIEYWNIVDNYLVADNLETGDLHVIDLSKPGFPIIISGFSALSVRGIVGEQLYCENFILSGTFSNSDLYRVSLNGGDSEMLIPLQQLIAITPQWIYYFKETDWYYGDIYRMNIENKTTEKIKDSVHQYPELFGDYIYYTINEWPSQRYKVKVDGSEDIYLGS